ncbi:hypothetical protein AC249_AIPGENE27431 [Exaiptasia diaphana]|nr:hypothetical protein AC249_AIPGENE27431 [Exaiptasia diaphana]
MLQRPWKDRPVAVWFATTALLLASTTTEVSCWKYVHFSSKPNTTIYTDIGRNVSMKWSFRVEENRPYKDEGKPFELMFGDWKYPGYISPFIVRIKGSVIKKISDKFHWKGNISNRCSQDCECEITLFNLTKSDFKAYGIFIFVHPHIVPLQQMLRIVRHTDDATISASLDTTKFKTPDSKGIRTRGQPIKVVSLVIGYYIITFIYSTLGYPSGITA